MAVAEQRVRVGHTIVGAAGNAQNGLAAPDVLERELEPIDLDPVTAIDQLSGLIGITLGIGTTGEPPSFPTPLRRP